MRTCPAFLPREVRRRSPFRGPPKSCRARRSGGPPPCRRKELPRPRPLGPPRGAAARGGPARPRPAVVRSCRAPDAVASLDPLIRPPDPPLRVLPATLLHYAHFQVHRPRSYVFSLFLSTEFQDPIARVSFVWLLAVVQFCVSRPCSGIYQICGSIGRHCACSTGISVVV